MLFNLLRIGCVQRNYTRNVVCTSLKAFPLTNHANIMIVSPSHLKPIKRSFSINRFTLSEKEPTSTIEKGTKKAKLGKLELKTGHMARMAESSATGKFNDTNVLVTVVTKPKYPAPSFLPLSVDYLHKASASGKIPGNFLRRDMGSSNYEVLVSRMIDRSVRPLFPSNEFNSEIQIVCNLLSFNGQDSPDVLCINTVSYALYNSNITWNGPIGCVRVGMINDKFVLNPSQNELEKSCLNLVVTVANNKNILMIEAWGDNIKEKTFTEALAFGAAKAYKVVEMIKESCDERKPSKVQPINVVANPGTGTNEEAFSEIKNSFHNDYATLYDILNNNEYDKQARDNAISEVRNNAVGLLIKNKKSVESYPQIFTYQNLSNMFQGFVKSIAREMVLKEKKRVDGRSISELRPILCQKDLYSCLHGSALFQRGQTQVLSTITFDSPDTMYRMDNIANMMSPSLTNFNKSFMLHYEFPGYAINEISRVGGRADRREIGHGSLAEKACYSLIPEEYPFTIRAHCEVLESNGSSSMASVCATSLALMDAGVPIKSHVCGIAMGIVTEIQDDKILNYEILTDINGFEDYAGDMDFKIAGTEAGITAVQADFKITGLPINIINEVVKKAKIGKLYILKKMTKCISSARTDKKESTPISKELVVPIEKRSKLIGVGGINIRRITSNTGVTITSTNETNFTMFAPNSKALAEAEELIHSVLNAQKEPELEFGGVYTAKVVEIRDTGLMVQFYPSMKPVLLPNSQLDGRKVVHGSAAEFKVGQEMQVKYYGRDPVDGKMRISRKALFNSYVPAKDLFALNV